MSPSQYIEFLDKEIQRYNTLRRISMDDISRFQFMGSASSLIDAKEKFLTIDFTSKTTESEQNNFTDGLE